MKYSIDESMLQIKSKSRKLKIKKQRRNVGFIAISGVLVLMMIIATIYNYMGLGISGTDLGENRYSKYGAFMVPNEAGGYILVGLICFVAAVVITLLCLRIKGHNSKNDSQTKYDNSIKTTDDIKEE